MNARLPFLRLLRLTWAGLACIAVPVFTILGVVKAFRPDLLPVGEPLAMTGLLLSVVYFLVFFVAGFLFNTFFALSLSVILWIGGRLISLLPLRAERPMLLASELRKEIGLGKREIFIAEMRGLRSREWAVEMFKAILAFNVVAFPIGAAVDWSVSGLPKDVPSGVLTMLMSIPGWALIAAIFFWVWLILGSFVYEWSHRRQRL